MNVFGFLKHIRSQRNHLVQTEEQYVFIHEALLEAVLSGNTEVPARNLYSHIQKLTQLEPGETITGMESEFKVSTSRRCCTTLEQMLLFQILSVLF